MASAGKHPQCKVCEKPIFSFGEELRVDDALYHRSCFKCRRCQKPLGDDGYAFFEGSPYCGPHFQLISNGTPDAAVSHLSRLSPALQTPGLQKAPSKVSSFKFGTQDKCVSCSKTVYPLEKVSVEGASYHKACFKCLQGGCSVSPSNYAALEGRIYCKHHFKQLFKEKGNYSQLLVKLPSAKIAEVSSSLAPPHHNEPALIPTAATVEE